MLILFDQESPNEWQDNVLWYISGFVIRASISKLKYRECIGEFLLDPRDSHALKVRLSHTFKVYLLQTKGGPNSAFPSCFEDSQSCQSSL